ncbi:NUDIX domain-containing protein [Candidatus Nomurabacteria bacterium]|nr:NUDIX domain-containing protein [Candidatus Nomurabacteria bacterium]
MADEYLDLVDEENNLTGKNEARSIVHSTGLWHRTVHIYLFRKAESGFEFLVHLRAKDKDLSPNCWDTRFGGHIKSGESIEDGVMKEIKEELGIDINLLKLIEGQWRKRDNYPNREFSKVYYLEYNEPLENLSFNDGEVQEIKWLSVEGILNGIGQEPEKWSGSKEGFESVYKFLKEKFI